MSEKGPKKQFRAYVFWMWLLAISGLLAVVALFALVSYSDLPEIDELENPKFEYATLVYTSDKKELGRYFKYNRDWVTYDELNPNIINALVATEDIRFFSHNGIDPRSFARAVLYLGKNGGGSTITQQLAKLFFTNYSRNFIKRVYQKLQEWIISLELEKRYTKEEILAMYLNKFEFIYDSYGISAAANTYFGKDQSELEPDEAAVLVGMLNNPVYYNPKMHPDRAQRKKVFVLSRMKKAGFLSAENYDIEKAKPIDLSNFKRQEDSKGLAPHFRGELTKWLKTTLSQPRYQKPGGGSYNIYLDGLKVYTTIDSKMQTYAEAAAKDHMKSLQEKYFKVWAGKDPWTYDADSNQKRIRRESLNSLVRNSERFRLLKEKYMNQIYAEIVEDFSDARLRDADVLRMLKAGSEKGYLATLMDREIITKNQAATYNKIMKSKHWPTLKSQWSKLQAQAKTDFNKKSNMKVFAYNAVGETDTIMTPMDSIKYHQMHMQIGMLAVDPESGEVKAWVGGSDHNYFQFDHINSNRQVGSTFKPFIYGTAIFQQGMSPCWKVKDVQYSIAPGDSKFGLLKKWEPSNANGKFSGENLTLYEGLKQSKNSVSVWLMKELGNVDVVRNLASNMGVPIDKIPRSPSICLGAAELSLMDMTGAYTTFANNGVYNKPIFVTKIEDKNGRLIYNAVPEQQTALPESYNYVMVDMLRYAASFIQGKYNFESEVGGKTGTTNNYVDGWFMGITPDLVVGTWVGGENPWIRFRSLANGQGGVMARPVFVDFLQKLEADPTVDYDKTKKFKKPEGGLSIEIDCKVYDEIVRQSQNDEKLNQFEEGEFEEEEF
ncbi:transglycosylase domain-containing protein [Portibacter lacus]|uniref:Penicillin-binding protein 1A n=1 Tax=Portibacter lacus TaxID=1099794 RepID=A0AA37SPW0_9BACT|nr:transglycosylase domain-containing protein [Portibacter lacus]GLR17019.1 penicillin-binding protein 1A [Portibacter lacus]